MKILGDEMGNLAITIFLKSAGEITISLNFTAEYAENEEARIGLKTLVSYLTLRG